MRSMSRPIRPEADRSWLAARERRLRLVMQMLGGREAEYRRSRKPTPPGLRRSIADIDEQLGDVHRRQVQLEGERAPSPAGVRPGRFDRTPDRSPRDAS